MYIMTTVSPPSTLSRIPLASSPNLLLVLFPSEENRPPSDISRTPHN